MPEFSTSSLQTPAGGAGVHKRKSTARVENDIASLADSIREGLAAAIPNDTIQLCGTAPLAIVISHPDAVLELAQEKLHAWSYRDVPSCWRRLFEEASLFKVVKLLHSLAGVRDEPGTGKKKRGVSHVDRQCTSVEQDLITDIIRVLDMGIALSGSPARRHLFEAAFQHLQTVVDDEILPAVPECFYAHPPIPLQETSGISCSGALTFEAFQAHLDETATPLVMCNVLDQWPAKELWKNPAHLLRLTLGGRRLVPVEIGSSYTDADWGQRIMKFGDYLQDYVLPVNPQEIGYLAQHDLLAQIPALRADIQIPDYCYTTPRSGPRPVSLVGRPPVAQLEEPLLNVWFGPKGTRSPLHTDPYHNILCQVVGYKYIRLYAPEETPALSPRGVDESGVNMDNTSQIDLTFADRTETSPYDASYPMFKHAKFHEVILGEGECIYIPAGWWHFVESLSTSFSVSFWWN